MNGYGINIDWDIKVKIFKEYLENGGVENIPFPNLLEDILKVEFDIKGKVIPETVSPLVNSAMLAIVGSQLMAPYYSDKHMSEYQTLLQKSLFFEQINIDSNADFDEVFEEYKGKENNLYRGVSESKWRLYSSLQRHWLQDKLYNTEKNYLELLKKIVHFGRIEHFKDIASILKEINVDSENDIAILSYLQHHGCPTPLMDWSFKFYNALFFAIDGIQQNQGTREIEDYFSLYTIEDKYLKTSSIKFWINESLASVEEEYLKKLIESISMGDEFKQKKMEVHFKGRKLFDRQKLKDSGIVSHMVKLENLINIPIGYFSDKDEAEGLYFSLENSKNILNQEGVFTWNSNPSKPLEQVGNELIQEEDGPEQNYRFCRCYNIHKKLASYVKMRIVEEGITEDFIYPDKSVSAWKTFVNSKINKI